jgi:hypothetical protein
MTLPSNILLGVGCDRNGDLINPVEYAALLSANGQNATSIGFFGRDDNDPMQVEAQYVWLLKWLTAMRAKGITTLITSAGTGGGDGGLANSRFSDAWQSRVLAVMKRLGPELVIYSPVCEGNIKEASDPNVQRKILGWHTMTQVQLVGWKLGWNFQCRPTPQDVWPGWIGICHPQNWSDGFPGQIILTDARMTPRINEHDGDYPNEVVIPGALTNFFTQRTKAGISCIYWGQWETNKINTAAVAAVAVAGPSVPGTTTPIANGWIYFKGDYFYTAGKWYYMKILDGQLCVQMATGEWRKFGQP